MSDQKKSYDQAKSQFLGSQQKPASQASSKAPNFKSAGLRAINENDQSALRSIQAGREKPNKKKGNE
ncbi:hypothetical protein [Sulfoacidibacillus ferrooxidans]|uniref:Uncharacterized protein n=1 Tax=Sulfoacidibacillus ferrooxidans TaxID=2005001 RepID=A0A9X1VEZ5_9BACL|nr:hypothetical protein [Sulfoacidibacillus ferrooxidans]MCI0184792.1 hypothetical protein [Sulfoacidibacillus ferrooxidans]